ncbi:MAG TPA: endo-1,4-beta-xylanase [Terriglobales bacterium]
MTNSMGRRLFIEVAGGVLGSFAGFLRSTRVSQQGPRTLRSACQPLGLVIGTTVDAQEQYRSAAYVEAVVQNFELIFVHSLMERSIEAGGLEAATYFRALADSAHLVLHIHPVYWHRDVPDHLTHASDAEVLAFMQRRAELAVSFVGRADQGRRPTFINFLNEAIWYNAKGQFGWQESPFHRALGDDLIAEAYLMVYRAAARQGLVVGRDLQLIYCDYDLYRRGGKSDVVLVRLNSAKRSIASSLSIGVSEVNIGIALQHHLYVRNRPRYLRPHGDADEFAETYKEFGAIGPVHITELSVGGTSDAVAIHQVLADVFHAAVKSRACQSLCLWQPLRIRPTAFDLSERRQGRDDWFFPNFVFTDELKPGSEYNRLLGLLNQLSNER